ncbi:histidinol dehydrogenase [Robertkochia solimangrovi]|uniref:histidinol dehydrogenase n=1 Tax=Robertkochia solimangrovi TaxID=2213046 RepID=UPI00117F02DA|nr:histidinol dehydrogenase [Robertkochia solimangrovi]TRZ45437.1 histidinol dehydrogenase [Robertkochia solimangrovi]
MKKSINPKRTDWPEILKRPTRTVEDIEEVVQEVFREVRIKGDEALFKYTRLFDNVDLNTFVVSDEEMKAAALLVPDELKAAIGRAKDNIQKFHAAQRTEPVRVSTSKGIECWQEKRPIESIGLYIPGGSAPLFSTVLMLAVPASIAGCEEIVLCSPPDRSGTINPVILYTAGLCGVSKIFKVGGIQAIGALTFGTESIPQVYKIFGPGNQYVTVAKQLATRYSIAIDMPAGPSELLVFADETAIPSYVAADLLSQAEHGADSQVILVTTSDDFAVKVYEEIEQQIKELPRRQIAQKAIENSRIIVAESEENAMQLINFYGPEHLIIACKNEDFLLEKIRNAGSVFVGNYTPESAGDYASGTNHTLPTNGYSKQYSGVNLDSYMKSMTFQRISKDGILYIGNTIELMAAAEGLDAHKNAVSLRLNDLRNT